MFRGMRAVQNFVGIGNCQGTEQKGHVNNGLPHQYLGVVICGVDKGFEQMDGADANDCSA
jgi:hypothetical protein